MKYQVVNVTSACELVSVWWLLWCIVDWGTANVWLPQFSLRYAGGQDPSRASKPPPWQARLLRGISQWQPARWCWQQHRAQNYPDTLTAHLHTQTKTHIPQLHGRRNVIFFSEFHWNRSPWENVRQSWLVKADDITGPVATKAVTLTSSRHTRDESNISSLRLNVDGNYFCQPRPGRGGGGWKIKLYCCQHLTSSFSAWYFRHDPTVKLKLIIWDHSVLLLLCYFVTTLKLEHETRPASHIYCSHKVRSRGDRYCIFIVSHLETSYLTTWQLVL